MASLQIRELPDGLYQALALRAEREHRNLKQQALTELRDALGGDPTARRQQMLVLLRAELAAAAPHAASPTTPAAPEALIRADRGR